MKEQEQQFVENVKSVIDKCADAVTIIDELAGLEKPSLDGLSINSQSLIKYIDNLEFEREDGELDGAVDDYDTTEQKIARKNLQNIKRILVDIDNDNWYKQIFWVELAYSHLKDGEYKYKLVHEKMNALSMEEAEKEKDQLKTKAPKQHSQDSNYSLEDVRVNVELVDSNGDTVEPQRFLLN